MTEPRYKISDPVFVLGTWGRPGVIAVVAHSVSSENQYHVQYGVVIEGHTGLTMPIPESQLQPI